MSQMLWDSDENLSLGANPGVFGGVLSRHFPIWECNEIL